MLRIHLLHLKLSLEEILSQKNVEEATRYQLTIEKSGLLISIPIILYDFL